MQRFLLFLLLFIFPSGMTATREAVYAPAPRDECRVLYKQLNLENKVSYAAFEQAMAGYLKIEAANKSILTLVDFSKPSTEERLFVIDVKNRQLLFSSLVAHGRNSGENYATSFSNEMGSHKSSLGFYLTGTTYQGRNGYSLLLDGLEKGINDRARERAIVIHGASYCNPSVIASSGRLGRSFGCPALPEALNRKIIDAIKGGCILYIYADNSDYLTRSSILGSWSPAA